MISPSPAPEAGCGPSSTAASYSSTQAREAHNTIGSAANTNTRNNNSTFGSENHVFHAHRQNHNSSKLPAFRFADLKREPISLPSLPYNPLSPQLSDTPDQKQRQSAHEQNRRNPAAARDALHHYRSTQTLLEKTAPLDTQQSPAPFTRTRSLKFKLPTTTATADPSTGSKRPASFPDAPRNVGSVYATRSQLSYVATPVTKRRLTASAVVHNATASTSPRSRLNATRPRDSETDDNNGTFPTPGSAATELAQPRRELGTVETAKSEERRKGRPPTSHKQPSTTANAAANERPVIPPIRAFRSSGSRKSVNLDMHSRRTSENSTSDEATGRNQRDRALRALEGRGDDEFSHLTPPDAEEMTTTTDTDNTADIFMRIAREDTAHRAPDNQMMTAEPSAISRIIRTAPRRPLSAAIPTYQVSSPPQISRRLSDPRQNTRSRQMADSQPVQQRTREPTHRTPARENPPPIITASEGLNRAQPVRIPQRPSPITPRQISFKDSFAESSSASSYQRRRQSVTENNHHASVRTTPYRSSNLAMSQPSQGRAYHPSPLVPKSVNVQRDEPHHGSDANPAVEGTESSSSTAAPSTVWDELDDLKSRINRLEVTGKMPSTSGVAMSRASDDRPRTATTNATTMSASPKRGSGTGPTQADGSYIASLPRESQPLLLSALNQTRGLVSPDVFSAIESAATDALALSSMMGSVGQPGPISSGASSIGYGGGITDRQLRRKADSICRSLTELCIALVGETGQRKTPQPTAAAHEKGLLLSPTFSNTPAAVTIQRRPSAIAETLTNPNTSPRTLTALEQRRQTLLAPTATPGSRYATAPATLLEPISAGRKSSLLLARIRRSGTEELEETPGRRSSMLLRTRRTGTEEVEESREGRKTSLLFRSRKTMNEEEDESRFRAPSRATTEVNSFRPSRDLAPAAQSPPEMNPLTSSALPRRRLGQSILAPRTLTNTAHPSAPITPARRYLERATPLSEPHVNNMNNNNNYNNNYMAEKFAEDRQRQLSLGHTAMLNRTGSVGRRNRDGIPSYSMSSPAAQQSMHGTPGGERERYR